MESYDVIIVGGGPAGLTAATYSARRNLKTLVVTKEVGGQVVLSKKVCNYPGFVGIDGLSLVKRFQKQAEKAGAEIIIDEVIEILQEEDGFLVKTINKELKAKAIILAFGKIPRNLGAIGEDKFIGKGVSYCATCDAPLYKGKVVVVVGGGNSALDATILLSKLAKKVYLVHRRDEFRGFEAFVDEVKKKKNVEILLSHILEEVKGDSIVRSVVLKDLKTGEKKEVGVDGVFIEIGYEVKPDLVKNLVKVDDQNQILINEKCQTFYPDGSKIRPGIFAAGDVTNTPFKQIVVAAGSGCIAALEAYNYLHGADRIVVDWMKK